MAKDKYDFYSVQCMVDGFGNDTYTMAIFPTKEKAQAYVAEHGGEIIGQRWGEYYNEYQ